MADGGSTDGTTEIAVSRARLVRSQAGRGRQLNAGARQARGELLLFLHADTWLSPKAGEALTEILRSSRVVGGCFSVVLRGPSADRPIARLLAKGINARSRWLRTATGDQAIFARRSAFAKIGGFPDWELLEDVGFYRRLRRLGEVVVLDNTVQTSDRRWRQFGYLRTIGSHLLLRSLFLAGASPVRLAHFYQRAASRCSPLRSHEEQPRVQQTNDDSWI